MTHPVIPSKPGVALFQERALRSTLVDVQWWFVVEDVVLVLIDSRDPKQYIQRMKQRDPELGKGWIQTVRTPFIATAGGEAKRQAGHLARKLQAVDGEEGEKNQRQ